MPRLTVRLSDAAVHQLEALAAQRHCTVSDVLREALAQATAPHPLDTCARHIVQALDQCIPGTDALVCDAASAWQTSVSQVLVYLAGMGLCAMECGFVPPDDATAHTGNT